jgi:hypothetical protein
MLESPVQSGSASSSPADQEVASSEGSDRFPWTKQWYPVAVVAFLATGRPHAIQVLGKDLVLWRDGSGSWRCFDDACPHRLVPLSEGRVESDGTRSVRTMPGASMGRASACGCPSRRMRKRRQGFDRIPGPAPSVIPPWFGRGWCGSGPSLEPKPHTRAACACPD